MVKSENFISKGLSNPKLYFKRDVICHSILQSETNLRILTDLYYKTHFHCNEELQFFFFCDILMALFLYFAFPSILSHHMIIMAKR